MTSTNDIKHKNIRGQLWKIDIVEHPNRISFQFSYNNIYRVPQNSRYNSVGQCQLMLGDNEKDN
jgi:hypothetical protein